MPYKTSLDKVAKGITIGATIFFAIMIIAQFLFVKESDKSAPFVVSFLSLLIYFTAFVLRPINYSFTNDSLIVHRLLKDVIINKNQIKTVEFIDKEKMKGAIRTFGVGGLFGYFGSFSKSGIGKMTWYATNLNNLVLIKTINNKNIVLTPNEPNKFIAEFKLKIKN